MRQGSPSGRRPRGRHNNGNGGGQQHGNGRNRSAASLRHQTFDSNGPEVRVRGNAWQVFEKYQSLARDARGSGDRVLAESYLQHAEHYYRVIEAINEATEEEQKVRQRGPSQPFDSQPDMPQNYFTSDGNLAGDGQPIEKPESDDSDANRRRGPRKAPQEAKAGADPFLPIDEGEEDSFGPQKFVAGA